LENLENVFIGTPLERGNGADAAGKMSQDYATQNLIIENNELKRKV